MSLLELDGVTVRYRDGARELTALDRVNLDVQAGELIGLYGERRAGKTTLLRVAAGLHSPDQGTVAFDSQPLAGISVNARARIWRRGGIALASCDAAQLEGGQPVIEHVALPLTNEGLTLGECEGLARPVLERVGLAQISHEPVGRLTLSDRIRLQLACAIVREPRLILVDEPAIMPGPSAGRQMQAVLRSLATDDGIAVLIASEDMVALAGVGRFLTLTDGRLRSTDSRRRVIPFPGGRGTDGQPERQTGS